MDFTAVHPFAAKDEPAPPSGLADDLKSWIRKEVKRQVQAEIADLKAAYPLGPTADTSNTYSIDAPAEPLERLSKHIRDVSLPQARASTFLQDIQAAIEAELEREIEATAWESVVLAFVDGLSVFDSMTIIFSSTVNAVVQSVFVLVLLNSFLSPELPELKEIQTWRMTYGHDKNNFLDVPESSLVSAVCSGDQSLIISAAQQTLFGTIKDYNANVGGMPIGAVLSVLTLFLWFLLVGQEVAGSLSLMTTLFSLTSATTELERRLTDEQSDRPFVLTSVSRVRMVFVVVMTAVRLFVCFALLIVGSIFLANTLSISDMMLNAVALAFILDIDELIFESFTSMPGKALRSNLQPLKRPSQVLSFSQALSFFGSIFAVGVMVAGWVSPNIALMTDIMDAMCGGNQDFIIGPSAWGLQNGIGTKPFDPDATSFRMEVVKEAWQSDAARPSEWSQKWDFKPSFTAFNAGGTYFEDPKAYVDFYGNRYMRTCDDFPLSEREPFFKETLEYQTGIADVSSCSAAASLCGDAGGLHLLRLLCPVTCGCHDPLSGLYRAGKASGCPVERCWQSRHYQAVLDSLACKDMDAATLAADPGWARFWQEAVLFRGSSPGNFETWTGIRDDFMAKGCGAFASLSETNKRIVCSPGAAAGAITSFCPVTCGCSKSSAMQGCATACL